MAIEVCMSPSGPSRGALGALSSAIHRDETLALSLTRVGNWNLAARAALVKPRDEILAQDDQTPAASNRGKLTVSDREVDRLPGERRRFQYLATGKGDAPVEIRVLQTNLRLAVNFAAV
jgi:hypothetical protein